MAGIIINENKGEQVQGPPKGWRPRALNVREKLEIVVRQRGLDDDTGERLVPLDEGVDFDHFPAITLRTWDEETQDTIPPANDLQYIRALNKDAHKAKTKRDKGAMAKIRRIRMKAAGMGKKKQKIQSRGFQKL